MKCFAVSWLHNLSSNRFYQYSLVVITCARVAVYVLHVRGQYHHHIYV